MTATTMETRQQSLACSCASSQVGTTHGMLAKFWFPLEGSLPVTSANSGREADVSGGSGEAV